MNVTERTVRVREPEDAVVPPIVEEGDARVEVICAEGRVGDADRHERLPAVMRTVHVAGIAPLYHAVRVGLEWRNLRMKFTIEEH